MWKWINDIILKFRGCFSREASFNWFVVILLGMMLRSDHLGVTSIIRELCIAPKYYETMLHFFRSGAWKLPELVKKWVSIVKKTGNVFLEEQMALLVIDGIKKPKEGRKIPGVKKLHQESENSSKAEYIHGHLFGVVSIIAGSANKMFCLPLQATIQDGVDTIRKLADKNSKTESHVATLVRQACLIASGLMCESILLMDRYFLSVPALQERIACEEQFKSPLVHIVTKAKKSATAYHKPVKRSGRGAPAKKGSKVKVMQLFTDCADKFITAKVLLYGVEQEIQYFCTDLLWGKKLYQELRFVLVKTGSSQSILVCTNTAFSPKKIIRLYGYRFKIEVSFKALSGCLDGLGYHFWTTFMPKLNRFAKKGDPNPIYSITDSAAQKHIISTLTAIENFVMMNCIALGLLQLISLRFFDSKNHSLLRWLRTVSSNTPSEATTAVFMRKSIYCMFRFLPNLEILQIIKAKQSAPPDPPNSFVS